jgi:hypothetical protein
MTFADIVDLWLALPRRDTGIPIESVAMKNFHETLMLPNQRGWFEACRAWANGGPAPQSFREIEEILNSVTPFQRRVAQAHLVCACLAKAPFSQSFDQRLALAATRLELCRESLRELVNEIRLGRPRQTIGTPVYITYPVVSQKDNAAMLARFVLERLSHEENLFGTTGRFAPAPTQLFTIEMDQPFKSTFIVAFEVAAARDNLPVCEDVRVSIELVHRKTGFMSINGTSGGGALAMGVAKLRTACDNSVAGNHAKLRTLEFNRIAVTAELGPQDKLNPVGNVANKSLEILKTREAEIHEINVLVVAQDQVGFGGAFDNDPKPKCFLWPQANFNTVNIADGAKLRSPESLLVIRAVDLSDAIDTLYQLQINIMLSVLAKPHLIAAYLLAGNRWFPPALLLLMFASWFLLPWFWFVPAGIASVVAAVTWVQSRIRKVNRQAKFCFQQRELAHSTETWAAMAATLQSYQSTRTVANICAWLKNLLTRSSSRPLTLKNLSWFWRRKVSVYIRLLILGGLLFLLASPYQHCVAEAVFPGLAKVMGGQSRRGFGNNTRYASVQPTCGFKGCSLQMLVGSYGVMRLSLEHKDRSARFLRITCLDSISYVKVNDTSAPARQITVPVEDDRAEFYYGIDENTPWKIVLEIEIFCYCNGRLESLQIVGHRAPPGE